ncbi:MAG: DUF465 domain-containing protein [Acidobacteriota bacterium]
MDTNTLEETKAHLMQTNEQYRDLLRRHHEYDGLVEVLENKQVLTAEEELEEHRLKKLKLHLKDQMEQMVKEHTLQHAVS